MTKLKFYNDRYSMTYHTPTVELYRYCVFEGNGEILVDSNGYETVTVDDEALVYIKMKFPFYENHTREAI